jgi:hypothetical protein
MLPGREEGTMTVEDVRKLYDETCQGVAGQTFPRWGKFERNCVGVLLAEIDRLTAVSLTDEEWLRVEFYRANGWDAPTSLGKEVEGD